MWRGPLAYGQATAFKMSDMGVIVSPPRTPLHLARAPSQISNQE